MAADDEGPHSAGWADYLTDNGWRDSPWRRSARGNLWRVYKNHRVVVTRRDGDGACRWLVAHQRGGVVHSPRTFATEGEAVADVMAAIAECERGDDAQG